MHHVAYNCCCGLYSIHVLFSCDGGNLELLLVRRSGALRPHVALFATQDIPAGAEVTFAYGPPNDGSVQLPGRLPQRCLCRTSACLGFLPSEAM